MSNFSDNLPVFYAYGVFFICRFADGFVLPVQRASFTRYFTLAFFFDYNFNFYVSPIQIKYISGRAWHCSLFFFYFCVNKLFRTKFLRFNLLFLCK